MLSSKTQKYIIGMVALVLLVSPFFVFMHSAHAAAEGVNRFGLDEAAKAGGFINKENPSSLIAGSPTTVQQVIGKLIGTLLSFVGVIFLLLMIYGGFQWMIGGKEGKEKEISAAKKIITSAIIGLVIIFAAYTITAFVTGQLGEAFTIGQ